MDQPETNFNRLTDLRAGKPLDKPLTITVIATGPVSAWKRGSMERTLQKFVVVDTEGVTAPMLALTYAPTEEQCDCSRNVLV